MVRENLFGSRAHGSKLREKNVYFEK